MDFTFSEDQLLFQESVRDFLVNEVTAERIRASWLADSGREDALWRQLAELGLTGMTVPEAHGGPRHVRARFCAIGTGVWLRCIA